MIPTRLISRFRYNCRTRKHNRASWVFYSLYFHYPCNFCIMMICFYVFLKNVFYFYWCHCFALSWLYVNIIHEGARGSRGSKGLFYLFLDKSRKGRLKPILRGHRAFSGASCAKTAAATPKPWRGLGLFRRGN